MIGQGHAGQRFEALTEMNLAGKRGDDCGACVLVKYRVGALEEVRERLAILAVADDAARHAPTDDMALDRAAPALQRVIHLREAIRRGRCAALFARSGSDCTWNHLIVRDDRERLVEVMQQSFPFLVSR